MKAIFAASLIAALLSQPCLAEQHPCAGDARARAGGLLKLHFDNRMSRLADNPGYPREGQAEGVMNWSLGDTVKTLKPIKSPTGRGKFDVLEIEGYIYKATYRMRFIYAQLPESCTPMGQEIIELSDPY